LQNGLASDNLFDASLLKSLPWDRKKAAYRGDISLTQPGPGLVLRPLSIHDYDIGESDDLYCKYRQNCSKIYFSIGYVVYLWTLNASLITYLELLQCLHLYSFLKNDGCLFKWNILVCSKCCVGEKLELGACGVWNLQWQLEGYLMLMENPASLNWSPASLNGNEI